MQQNTNISLGTRNDFFKVSKCKSRCFLCQDHFIPRTSVKSTLYNKNLACKLRGNVNCRTTNVIYLLECFSRIDFLDTRQQLIMKKLITI